MMAGQQDAAAGAFLAYWILAFFVLSPIAWFAIAYDMDRRKEWPLLLKRLYLGFLMAVLLGSGGVVFAASKAPQPKPQIDVQDPCLMEPIVSMPWWEKLFMGCW